MESDGKSEVPLGPFLLERRIGRGGMGDVWAGRHVTHGVDVAVKLIRSARAEEPQHRAMFRREVRATAMVRHPNIVTIFDFGEVPATTVEHAPGSFSVGELYLVMELADGGSLDHAAPFLNCWADLRLILSQLLDGLAHAHARGLTHLDIKPANILRCSDGSRWRYLLADLGISFLRDDARTGETSDAGSGTPLYMPLEQMMGEWRKFGPWTDMYALGCVAYELACGRPPFMKPNLMALALAHAQADRPPLEPRFDVPVGFEAWVHRMMAIDPRARFQRAADALLALARLDDGGDVTATSPTTEPVVHDAETQADRPLPTEPMAMLPTLSAVADESVLAEALGSGGQRDPEPTLETAESEVYEVVRKSGRPPLPRDWRRRDDQTPDIHLVGAGLGLYGLRPVPFVDREEERDVLWSTFRRVSADGAPGVVLLAGDPGMGKSRLAAWMAHRIDELGQAVALELQLRPVDDVAAACGRLLANYVSAFDVDVDEARELLRRAPGGEAFDDLLLGRAASLAAGGREGRMPFESAGEVFEVVADVLRGATEERPVVLRVDDLHHAAFSLEFIEALLDVDDAFPLCVFATIRAEEVAANPALNARLHDLRERDDVEFTRVGALGDADHRDFVERLLQLEADLSERVVSGTDGNPLFAAQLVGGWVEDGKLRPGNDGFEAESDVELRVASSLDALWSRRIEQLAEAGGLPFDATLRALQVASALGLWIDEEEWRLVCDRLDVPIPDGLVEALLNAGLAAEEGDGWMFSHATLREALSQSARDSDHFEDDNRACAAVFSARKDELDRRGQQRLAEFLVEAGDVLQATRVLHDVVSRSFHRDAIAIHDRVETLLDEAGVEPHAEERLTLHLNRAGNAVHAGHLETTRECLRKLDEAPYVSEVFQAEFDCIRGWLALYENRPEEGLDTARHAIETFVESGDLRREAETRGLLGNLLQFHGDPEAALEEFQRASEQFEALGERRLRAWNHYSIGSTLSDLGRLEESRREVERALEQFRELGDRNGVATALDLLGGICFENHDVEDAIRYFEESLRMAEVARDLGRFITHENLGRLHADIGNLDEALVHLRAVLDQAERDGFNACVNYVYDAALYVYAQRGAWDEWDEMFPLAKEARRDHDFAYEICGETLEKAAQRAAESGMVARARDALEEARIHFEGRDDDDGAARVARALEELTP